MNNSIKHHKHLILFLTIISFASACFAERPLKVNDSIQLLVFGEDSLGASVKIDSSGSVNFPLIGNVAVVDKSASQVASEVETMLERDYIRDANVTVSVISEFIPEEKKEPVIIRQPAPRAPVAPLVRAEPAKPKSKITVMGEVKRPGTIYFEGNSADILEIIAQVSGLTPLGNSKKVTVRRVTGEKGVHTLNLKNLQSSTTPFLVYPGDTILVRKRTF